jgi:Glycosyltransferase family 87
VTPRARSAVRDRLPSIGVGAFVVVVVVFVGARLIDLHPWTSPVYDMWAYWSTRLGLDYASAVPGETGDFIYSPAFAHLIAPFVSLPWPVFAAAWTAGLTLALWWLGGRWALPLALLPPAALSLAIGQIDVLMAVAIVVGFRWPAVWAFPILTKITPGIGLLWFAARREWRSLGIALGATAVVAALSMIIDPAAWLGWLGMIGRLDFPSSPILTYLPVPVWIRLPLVAALVVWGARTDRPWVMPIAACLSLPTVWLNSPTIILGVLPLLAVGATTPAGAWLRSPDAEPELVRRRLAEGFATGLARMDADLDTAWRSARRVALRWAAAILRRAGVDRRWSRRASSVDR